jgi:hypothetical protein
MGLIAKKEKTKRFDIEISFDPSSLTLHILGLPGGEHKLIVDDSIEEAVSSVGGVATLNVEPSDTFRTVRVKSPGSGKRDQRLAFFC